MLRFNQMKCLVLVSTLSAMFAVATDPDLSIRMVRESGSIGQVRELLRSNRQLQTIKCEKTSVTMDAALGKLSDRLIAAALQNCASGNCGINYASYSPYTTYKNGCIAAKGAFATYKISVNCGVDIFVFTNAPVCLVSTKVKSSCGAKSAEDDLEDLFDFVFLECTATATNTGYTDYYSPKPVKKPIKKRVKLAVRRRVLATK
jgi:hypothetical protein